MIISRLRKREDFLRVAGSGGFVATKGLILQYMKNPENKESIRLGFTVSGKVGGAIIRNRIKRRLKNLAESFLEELVLAGHDYVIVARKAALSRTYQELAKDLKYAFHKARG